MEGNWGSTGIYETCDNTGGSMSILDCELPRKPYKIATIIKTQREIKRRVHCRQSRSESADRLEETLKLGVVRSVFFHSARLDLQFMILNTYFLSATRTRSQPSRHILVLLTLRMHEEVLWPSHWPC